MDPVWRMVLNLYLLREIEIQDIIRNGGGHRHLQQCRRCEKSLGEKSRMRAWTLRHEKVGRVEAPVNLRESR